jgi:hypothetical protein
MNRTRRDVRREEKTGSSDRSPTLRHRQLPGAPTKRVGRRRRLAMKWWKLLMLALLIAPIQLGCEVDADDDDGGSLKVDVDD